MKTLAERGERGEQDAARSILASLEANNPGIAEAAARRTQGTPEETSPSGFNPFTNWPGGRPPGNWENIFKYAKWAYETVSDVAETVIEAQKGRELAEEEVDFAGRRRGGALTVSLKFTYAVVEAARDLTPLQKETFRQALHQRLDEYLDAILDDESE